MNTEKIKFTELFESTLGNSVESIAPNFRRKSVITDEQLEKIIDSISIKLTMEPEEVLIGMILLFLQGASSAGAPVTMSVEFANGKCLTKRNIVSACNHITGHEFIRRIAEKMAKQIGSYASKYELSGELAYRIDNKLKAEGQEGLTLVEKAYCSSFSQVIPELNELCSSDRLQKLLAEDYQKRFENKKKQKAGNDTQKGKGRK